MWIRATCQTLNVTAVKIIIMLENDIHRLRMLWLKTNIMYHTTNVFNIFKLSLVI